MNNDSRLYNALLGERTNIAKLSFNRSLGICLGFSSFCSNMSAICYHLNKEVKVVLGKNEAAIYCLDTHKIIRISYALGKRILDKQLSSAEIKQLLENNIISLGDEPPEIGELTTSMEKPCFKKVWLEITPLCNLRCTHCYMGDEKTMPCQIEWGKILDYLFFWGVEEIVLLGGEPFCSLELMDIVKKIRASNQYVKIIIITNGTCCSLTDLQFIKKNNIALHFSLLGATALEHDTVTQTHGSFKKMMCNIGLAKQLGINILVVCTLRYDDNHKKKEIKKMLDSNFPGLPLNFHLMRPQGRISSSGAHIYDETQLATRITMPFYCQSTQHHPCLYRKVVFSYNGEVYPCIMARYIHKNVLDVLSHNPNIFFSDWWDLTKDKIEGCCNCALRYACFDCRGYAKSLTSPPIICSLASKLVDKQ